MSHICISCELYLIDNGLIILYAVKIEYKVLTPNQVEKHRKDLCSIETLNIVFHKTEPFLQK